MQAISSINGLPPCYIPPPEPSAAQSYARETLALLNKAGILGRADLQVAIIAEGTIQVTDGERLIRVSGLDQLGKRTLELMRKDQNRHVELDKQIGRISNVNVFQTAAGVFSAGVGIAAGVATGGTLGVVIAAGALLNGAHQVATRVDAYDKLAGQFTEGDKQRHEVGQALNTYVGYLCFATTLLNLGMGGTELAKKGFEEATKVSAQGISGVTGVGTGLANITQVHLEGNKAILQIEGEEIRLELTDIGFDREAHNEGIRQGNKAEEAAMQGLLRELSIKNETATKIIRGR